MTIPLNGEQRDRLSSHLFLASVGAGDKVTFSGLEQAFLDWVQPLINAVSEYFLKVKLGSTIIPDYAVEELVNNKINIFKTNLEQFTKYANVSGEAYLKQNKSARGWIWAEGFHWFLSHNYVHSDKYPYKVKNGTGYTVNDLEYMFENKLFHPYQLNFIAWVKAYHKRFFTANTRHTKTLDFFLPDVIVGQQKWSRRDYTTYRDRYIFPALKFIEEINIENITKEEEREIIDKKKNNLTTFATVAGIGALVFSKLK